MTTTMIQHPIARIQAIIGELQDATHCDAHDRARIDELWNELDNHIVMLVNPRLDRVLDKAIAYDRIAGIVSITSPGQQETKDADSDEASGRGHSDRGGSDGERPGSEAGSGEAGDPSSETDQGSSGGTSD